MKNAIYFFDDKKVEISDIKRDIGKIVKDARQLIHQKKPKEIIKDIAFDLLNKI